MKTEHEYDVDDRGNIAEFYCDGDIIATLDREAGDTADQYTWDGGDEVTAWAVANGYAEQIAEAKKNGHLL